MKNNMLHLINCVLYILLKNFKHTQSLLNINMSNDRFFDKYMFEQ